jgi:mono/diheme cytochrome c family protein
MSVMKRFAVTLCLVATGACASSQAEKGSGVAPVASVNPDFKVDATKAALGGEVWRQKACFVCHTVGAIKGDTRGTAPDLMGVTERRDLEWIKKFLLDTTNMIESDPIAHALYERYNFQKMPNMHLTPEQADNLTHYLQSVTNTKRAS